MKNARLLSTVAATEIASAFAGIRGSRAARKRQHRLGQPAAQAAIGLERSAVRRHHVQDCWLIRGHHWHGVGVSAQCPLLPRKRTFAATVGMSALCQNRHRGSCLN